jgi:hypothetical protein
MRRSGPGDPEPIARQLVNSRLDTFLPTIAYLNTRSDRLIVTRRPSCRLEPFDRDLACTFQA